MTGISSASPDWSRERIRSFWDPSRKLLRSIRRHQYWKSKSNLFAWVLARYYVVTYRFWSFITGAEIPLNGKIGGGLMIPHPNGIVIHPDVEIGPNCLIFQQVTLGSNGRGIPSIGGHVDVGAGAKILGPISVGDHAIIGANAVVVKDVLKSSTVIGVPAKPLVGP